MKALPCPSECDKLEHGKSLGGTFFISLMTKLQNRVARIFGNSKGQVSSKTVPDPLREDPKSRSLNGGSYKVPLVVYGPKLGDLLSRSSRGSGVLPLDVRIRPGGHG